MGRAVHIRVGSNPKGNRIDCRSRFRELDGLLSNAIPEALLERLSVPIAPGKFPPIERFSSEFLHVTRPHGNSPSLVYLRARINHMWSIWVADRTLPYVEGPCKERRSVLNAKRTIWNKRHLCQSGANICRENVDDPPRQAQREQGRGRLWASRHRHRGRLP